MEESVQPKDRAAWRAWLARHHTRAHGVWLITYKKSSGKAHLDYEASVEEALCYGWIDIKGGKVDGERTKLWFAPRKPEAAKRDGSWNDALDSVDALEVPPDLVAAFAGYTQASRNFDSFPPSVKRGILDWIRTAKRPEARARRVEETARLAQDNLRANQWRPSIS